MNETTLEVRGISKEYPGVKALSDVDLTVNRGEIHGVVGENGAGKSTLMAIVSGAVKPDSGTVRVAGSELLPATPDRARELGVAIVRQEPALLPDLSVAENLFLKVPPSHRPAAGDMRRWAVECLAHWNTEVRIDIDYRVEQLTAEERFIVEIAAALASLPDVLILDEPTEHLGSGDVDRLFDLVRTIAVAGCAVVYISHRIHEVRSICSSVTVLRDGIGRGTFDSNELTEDDLVTLIVGRNLDRAFPPKRDPITPPGTPRLHLEQLRGPGFETISLSVAPGEIVGLAGIEGNGQRDVLRALAGLRRSSGTVTVDGIDANIHSRRSGLRSAIGFLPGDRHREGMLGELSVAENIELRNLDSISTAGFVSPRRSRALVAGAIKTFDVKTPTADTPMGSLSGGNQQKAIIAGLLQTKPRVVLIDEPTQGVDVGAKVEIYDQLREMARTDGVSMVVVSSDALELAGLCDRVLVFSRGSVVATLERDNVTEAAITSAALRADTHRAGTVSKRRFTWLSGDLAPVAIIAAAVIVIALFSGIQNPFYFSAFNIASLLTLVVPLAAVALGQATVMMTGGIDLSVGPLMGFLVVVASFLLTNEAGLGGQLIGWVLLIAIAVGVGLLNWVLIELLGLPPLVATLATYFALQAMSLLWRPAPGGIIASNIVATVSYKIGALIPIALLVMLALVAVLQFVLRRTLRGLQLRAVGSDPSAALLTGARPALIRLAAYVSCSLLAGVGAIALMSQVRTGDPAGGTTYTLISVSAAVIGGTSLFGGRGTYIGVLLGALLVQQVIGAIPFLKLPPEWQYYAVGLLTLAAVALFSKSRQLSRVE